MITNRKSRDLVEWQINPFDESLRRDFRMVCVDQGRSMVKYITDLVEGVVQNPKRAKKKIGSAHSAGYDVKTAENRLNIKSLPTRSRDAFVYTCRHKLEMPVYQVLSDIMAYEITKGSKK